MATHGEDEGAADLESEKGSKKCGAEEPEDEGVPLPGPEQMGEAEGGGDG